MTTQDAIAKFEKQLAISKKTLQAMGERAASQGNGILKRAFQENQEMTEAALEALYFYQTHTQKRGKLNRGDKIRSMSNSRLAMLFSSILSNQRKSIIEHLKKAGIPISINIVEVPMMTIAMHKKWLDEPAEEDPYE